MPATKTEPKPEPEVSETLPPVVVDLGKVPRKRVKQLRRGRGPLVGEIEEVVEDVRQQLGDEADGKSVLPIVLLYRSKPKRKKRFLW